ncbi:MAG: glycosyltransferase family 4 protein [Vicinamibacterales bacterium]
MDERIRPRIAWFTPLPPARSGIAQYSLDVLPGLSARYDLQVFVADPAQASVPPGRDIAVRSAHDFLWVHRQRAFDLVVYQLGNAPFHDYMWAYLTRFPGLVVLHDGQFHHARGRFLRERGRPDDYLAEFAFSHPEVDRSVVELGIRGRLGSLIYYWPMRSVPIQASRAVAVHNRYLAEVIASEHPDTPVELIDMGVPALAASSDARQRIRARHQIPDDAVVFTALGEITPEKRIAQSIRAISAVARQGLPVHLLLAGGSVPFYDPLTDARACGVADRVTIAGYVSHDELGDYLAAADVCLCLRWPTSRETSAAWLRCLAAGRPTVISDLAHTTDVPAYDPRSWTPLHFTATRADAFGWPLRDEPACVSIDIIDEEHSLQLAVQRLAADAPLRDRLGRRARAVWEERFTLAQMVARYDALLASACATPMPSRSALERLPAHFRTDGTEHTRALLRGAGLPAGRIASLWTAEQPEGSPSSR